MIDAPSSRPAPAVSAPAEPASAVPASVWLPLLRTALERDGQFRLPLRGASMRPTLPESCVIVVVPLTARPRLGSLLVFAQGDSLVAHRLVRRTATQWIAQGDGRLVPDAALLPEQVLGQVIAAYRDGRRIWPGRLTVASTPVWVARHHGLRLARALVRRLRRWRNL